MAIVVQNNQGLIAPNSSLSTSFFYSSKPRGVVYLNWVLGTSNLNNMDFELDIPYYKALARWENYSDFEIEIYPEFNNSVKWLKINNADTHKSDLNDIIVEDGLTFFKKNVTFSFVNLNLLSLGYNSVGSLFKVFAYNSGVRELVSEGTLLVVLNVDRSFVPKVIIESSLDTWLGYIASSYYKNSGVYVSDKGLYVYHNTPISISHPNFTANISTFNYHSYITFDINEQWLHSLGAGTHDINFYVNYNQGNVPYKLVVTIYEDALPDLAISVLPSELVIDIYRNADAVSSLSATVFSNTNWYVNNDLPLWLTMSKNSGNGVTDVAFNFMNYTLLNAGAYKFNLPIKSAVASVDLPITMNLFDFVEYPFVEGGLFFTGEDESIEFNANEPDSFISLTMHITTYQLNIYKPIIYNREFKIPLYQGMGVFRPGKIVHELFAETQSITDLVSVFEGEYIKTQYAPAKVDFDIKLKSYLNDSVIRVSTIKNVLFIKGQKPYVTDSYLALLSSDIEQEYCSITPNSVIAFSFINRSASTIKIYVNGLLEDVKEVLFFSDNIEKSIRTYFQFENKYKVGDVVEYQVQSGLDTRVKRYLVMPNGPSSTHVLFKNGNGVVSAFELRGRVKINGAKSHTTQKKMRGMYEISKKIATESDYVVSINTGQLIKGDISIVESIIDATDVWISYNNKSEWIQVDAITNKTDLYDDFENEIGIVLEFNVLKTEHARVYPSRF